MEIEVRKIGNAYGVVLPREVLAQLQAKAGSWLPLLPNTRGRGYRLTAAPTEFERQMQIAKRLRKRYSATLRDLAR